MNPGFIVSSSFKYQLLLWSVILSQPSRRLCFFMFSVIIERRRSCVFNINFEQFFHIMLVFPLLTLNK